MESEEEVTKQIGFHKFSPNLLIKISVVFLIRLKLEIFVVIKLL